MKRTFITPRQTEALMKKLKKYVGKIVAFRPDLFVRLMEYARREGPALDNRFLVARSSGKSGLLICYGGRFRFLVSPADVSLV